MATVQGNLLLEGVSGMFGRSIVFRSLRGKTVIAPRPALPTRQSEKQRTNRSRFRDASAWAQITLQDPAMKEYYKKKAQQLKLPNAYTAAITDYMRKPTVEHDGVENGTATYFVSKKDFTLKHVTVTVTKQGVKETHPATRFDGTHWTFALTTEELQGEVQVQVMDEAERGIVMSIP